MDEFCHLCALYHFKYQFNLKGHYPEFKLDLSNEQFSITEDDKKIIVSAKYLYLAAKGDKKLFESIDNLIDASISQLYE